MMVNSGQIKIAHIIMAHKAPRQLERLVQRLKHPNSHIYVHLDKKIDLQDAIAFSQIKNVAFIKNRVSCNWGGNSLLMGILSAVEEVLSINEEYDFINLLSGQDYPLVDAEIMFEYFQKSQHTNFLDFNETIESEWWSKAKSRYERYHFTDAKFNGKYLVENLFNKLLPKRKFPYDIKLYGSNKSTWWTITGDCAKYLVEKLRKDKILLSFLKYSWGTDEFIPSSLILNSHFKARTINNNLRYIDWSANNVNPKILTINDFEEIKQSNMLFARKFDLQVDEKILDKIDNELLNWKQSQS